MHASVNVKNFYIGDVMHLQIVQEAKEVSHFPNKTTTRVLVYFLEYLMTLNTAMPTLKMFELTLPPLTLLRGL